MSINDLFEKHDDEYLKFEKVSQPKSSRPDLHAFIVLDELFPKSRDIVSACGHDEIYLDVTEDEIEGLEENQIIELIRCGVMFYEDSLKMLV